MFVCEEEKISNKEDIIKRVLELKPKFKEREVSECLLPAYCSCAA